MTIFGKPLSEYVAFCKWFLVVIPVVGVLRLALSLGGAPNTVARWATMTALVWIATIYLSVRVHTSGFGSYKQLLVLCALVNLAAQAVSIFGIVLAILTGTDNIYSAPEYAFGADGRNWFHVAMHALVGTTAGSLVPWLIGSAILAVTRRASGASSPGDFRQV
jgi:hypothetical protein